MVNSAWSWRLVVEFLLQVFTIRQASACEVSLTGLVFGLLIVRQNAARSDRRRRAEAPILRRGG